MVDFILKVGIFDVVQTTYSYAIGAPFRDAAIAVPTRDRSSYRQVEEEM
jgi:hypothetical protein